MTNRYHELKADADVRLGEFRVDIEEMSELARVYDGELPMKYTEYFPVNTPKHIVNYIRLAWDDLAQTVGRSPEVQVDPIGSSNPALSRASKLERIVQGYFQNSRPYESAFLFQNAWNIVGLGRAVFVVVPDTERGYPRFEARDPRTALPKAKRMVGNYVDELEDIIFVHEVPTATALAMGLYRHKDGESDPSTVTLYECLDDQKWEMVGPDATKAAIHGLGRVPAVYMQTFSPNKSGTSQFAEQISLMVAVSRIITQKMAYIDRLIYPMVWVKGQERELRVGPNAVNVLNENGAMGQIAPPATLQVDRDLATLEKYQRILNRNPEVRQGEVDGKGAYVGAKTLESLNDAVDNSVARFWEVIQAGYQKGASIALEIDEKMLGGKDKSIQVVSKGQGTVERYTPSVDIAGRRDVRVAYGFGVGGSYEAFLENVQGFQSGLVPKRDAVEAMPGTTDANRKLRELELDRIDEIAFAGFEQQAGNIDMVLWAKLRKEMENKGLSWYEAIGKYEKELKDQAAEASQQPVPQTALTTPEANVPQVAGEQPLPGIPPAALLGG